MDELWFIVDADTKRGPYRWIELRDRARNGLLTKETLIHQGSSGHPMPAGRFPSLFVKNLWGLCRMYTGMAFRTCIAICVRHRVILAPVLTFILGVWCGSLIHHQSSTHQPDDVSGIHLLPVPMIKPIVPVLAPVSLPAQVTVVPEVPNTLSCTLRCWNDLIQAQQYAVQVMKNSNMGYSNRAQPLTVSDQAESFAQMPGVCQTIATRFESIDVSNVDHRLSSLVSEYHAAFQTGADLRTQYGSSVDRLSDLDYLQTPEGRQVGATCFLTLNAVIQTAESADIKMKALCSDLSSDYHVTFNAPPLFKGE